jgi:hypothetical protein
VVEAIRHAGGRADACEADLADLPWFPRSSTRLATPPFKIDWRAASIHFFVVAAIVRRTRYDSGAIDFIE